MKYYYLVESLDENIKTGIYGRRLPTEEEKKDLTLKDLLSIFNHSDTLSKQPLWLNILLFSNLYSGALTFAKRTFDKYKKLTKHKPLLLTSELEEKAIIIPCKLLENNYVIGSDEQIFHGAFSKFPNKEEVFKTIMNSDQKSNLVITEKKIIDKKHFGGLNGNFETGLYCEHPKDNNILLPLDKSNDLIKNLILEEIIHTYEALGAKRIEINDVIDLSSEQKAGGIFKGIKFTGDANQKYSKTLVRKKEYGKGTFDPARAMKNKKFIYDMPNIMTTIDGRINGNQTLESFSETIDLSGGLNLDVLTIFNAGLKLNYKKNWQFEVEFYDKTEI